MSFVIEDIMMELMLVCGVERLECGKTCEDSGALLAFSALARRAKISVSWLRPAGPLSFAGRRVVGWLVEWFWTWAFFQMHAAAGNRGLATLDALLEAFTDLGVLALLGGLDALEDGGGFAWEADEVDDDDDAVADSDAVGWAGIFGPMNPWISGITNAGSMGAGTGGLMATLAKALATSVRGLDGNENSRMGCGRS